MEILIQGLGLAGMIMNLVSFQLNKHRQILFFRTLNELLFAVQYFFLGVYSGMAANFLVCLRNMIFSHCVKNNRSTRIPIFIFCGVFLIFGLCTWQGLSSLMIILVKLLSTLAYGNENPRIIRGITLFASAGWFLFNIIINSYSGALCELISLSAILSGIFRYDLFPRLSVVFARR